VPHASAPERVRNNNILFVLFGLQRPPAWHGCSTNTNISQDALDVDVPCITSSIRQRTYDTPFAV